MAHNEKELIAAARQKALALYEGKLVPHHSCGVCMALTFNLPAGPYQALRRGGVTGDGECGAIKGCELVIGQYFGDTDPAGPVSPKFRSAMAHFRSQWEKRAPLGPGGRRRPDGTLDIICNHLTGPQGDFAGENRHKFCLDLVATMAEILAETLLKFGATFEIKPVK
jgi:hypothetical protein